MTDSKPRVSYTISEKKILPDRPEPILANLDVVPYNRSMAPQTAIDALVEGYTVLVIDYYSTGIALLRELKAYVKSKHSDQSFQGQREFRAEFHRLSRGLLLVVRNGKLEVKKAPDIGWFEILYPELEEFLLSFTQVQGLNSAWQWYKKGITIPVLNGKIHPFYGTYFPTRFDHLKLFNTWLKHYDGERKLAYDIGIGSGVLSFVMMKHKFERIYGTDSNANAIIGISESLKENKQGAIIELHHGDLFADVEEKAELIVFNPPWLPGSYDLEGLDKSVYYDAELFPRFFSEAIKHLSPGGRVVLLFSNLAQITNLSKSHPIEEELAKGRFEKVRLMKKEVGAASKKTRRNQTWRASEQVELWEIRVANLVRNPVDDLKVKG